MYKMYFLFIYIILFHSLAVYEVMLYLKYNQNQSNVYILFISFFFWMKNRVHAASNKKNYSFSFKSDENTLFVQACAQCFPKEKFPHIL